MSLSHTVSKVNDSQCLLQKGNWKWSQKLHLGFPWYKVRVNVSFTAAWRPMPGPPVLRGPCLTLIQAQHFINTCISGKVCYLKPPQELMPTSAMSKKMPGLKSWHSQTTASLSMLERKGLSCRKGEVRPGLAEVNSQPFSCTTHNGVFYQSLWWGLERPVKRSQCCLRYHTLTVF